MAAKSRSAELSNEDFLIKTLRNIADYEAEDPVIRLKACDRIAVLVGAYTVVSPAKSEDDRG